MIAGSFSQTYLRNAFNNGFLCIEIPELVKRLRAKFADAIARKEKTIIPGDEIEVDFTTSTIRSRRRVPFPAAGQRATIIGRRGRSGEPGEPEFSGAEGTIAQRCRSLTI